MNRDSILRAASIGTPRPTKTPAGLAPGWRRCLCAALLCSVLASSHAAEILIIQSRPGEVQDAFVAAFGAGLKPGKSHRLRIASLSGPDPVAVAGADLVVAVGAAAARAAATGNDAPVLAALISQQEATTLRTQAGNRRLGAIVLDQPMLRTLRLTRLVAPGARRATALFGSENTAAESQFRLNAKRVGLIPETTRIDDEGQLGPALDRLLESNQVLVAVPDGQIFNRNTAMSILLTSYRYRTPVIGFSEAYVRAGAIAAVFSAPDDIGRQAAEWVNEMSDFAQLADQTREPRYFRIAVNDRVSQALGLETQDAEAIAQAIRSEERRP